MHATDSALARELRQSKPFSSVAEEAAVGLLRTADVVRRYYGTVIEWEGRGLTLPQYNVLRILRGAGSPGLPTLEIAERLVERTPGVTRMIDRLVAKDWVARHRCTEDRRVVYCQLTETGRRLIDRLDDPLANANASVLAMLGEGDLRGLVRLLDTVRAEYARRESGPDAHPSHQDGDHG